MLTHNCQVCQADVEYGETVAGGGDFTGVRVHLHDWGPRHAEVSAHPLTDGPRFGRTLTDAAGSGAAIPEPAPDPPAAAPDAAGPAFAGPVVVWPDVSQWQGAAYDGTFRGQAAAYRVSLSTTLIDSFAAANGAWCHQAAASGQLTAHIGYHVWYPGNEAGQATTFLNTVGPYRDRQFVAMIDVESWGGSISGDHSAQITALAGYLAAQLGQRSVKVYGNQGDLDVIYPNRPGWLGVVKASYGPNPPADPWDGWQYTDGTQQWPVPAGWPRTDLPFGPTDHNAYLGTLAQFAGAYGIGAAPSPGPTPSTAREIDEMILLNNSTGVGVLVVGGKAVWLHSGADATAMHSGGVPMSGVTAALFGSTISALGGGMGAEQDGARLTTTEPPAGLPDLRPHLGLV